MACSEQGDRRRFRDERHSVTCEKAGRAHLDEYHIPPMGYEESTVDKMQELEKGREAIRSPWTALGLPVPELI